MKTKIFSGISMCSWHYWKMINDYDFMEVIFQYFGPKLQEILKNWVMFVVENSIKF